MNYSFIYHHYKPTTTTRGFTYTTSDCSKWSRSTTVLPSIWLLLTAVVYMHAIASTSSTIHRLRHSSTRPPRWRPRTSPVSDLWAVRSTVLCKFHSSSSFFCFPRILRLLHIASSFLMQTKRAAVSWARHLRYVENGYITMFAGSRWWPLIERARGEPRGSVSISQAGPGSRPLSLCVVH